MLPRPRLSLCAPLRTEAAPIRIVDRQLRLELWIRPTPGVPPARTCGERDWGVFEACVLRVEPLRRLVVKLGHAARCMYDDGTLVSSRFDGAIHGLRRLGF